MVDTGGEWPTPSNSARVRRLLTVAEGLILGSGGVFLLLIVSAFILLVAESSAMTVGVGVLLVVFLALTARNLWVFGIGRHSGQNGSGILASDFEVEWGESRSTLAVCLVAILAGVAFGAGAGIRWGWNPFGWLVLGSPVLAGVLWFGFLLRLYVTYKVRGELQ